MARNPYEQADVIGSAARGANLVLGLQGIAEDRKDRTQDRELRGLQIETAKSELDASDQSAQREQKWRDMLEEYPRAKRRIEALSDPEVFDPLVDVYDSMGKGNADGVRAAWPKAIEAYNRLNEGDINEGLGEKVPGTEDVIVGKRVSDLLSTDRGTVIPELSVSAMSPDGKVRDYPAPPTEGRNSDPKARVIEIGEDDVQNWLNGAIDHGLRVQNGELTIDQLNEEMKLYGLSIGRPIDEIEAIIGGKKTVGDPTARLVGGKPAMVQHYADGSYQVIDGVSPYDEPGEAPSDWKTYQLAKQEGFKGSFIDFQKSKRGDGLNVTLPDGTVISSGGGSQAIPKPVQNDLGQKVVDFQAGLDRLRQVQSQFRREYLTLAGRGKALLSKGKEMLGGELSEEDSKYLTDFSQFKGSTLDNLNRYIKEITGAAMSQSEAKRIQAGMPSMDDAPTEFEAKMDNTMRLLSRAQARAYYTLQNGLTVDKVALNDIDGIIQQRGEQLEKQIKAGQPGIEDQQLRGIIRQQLAREFGVAQ